MKKINLLSRAVIALAISTSCFLPAASASSSSEKNISLSGSSTLAPLVGEIAKRFESAHPGVRLDVQTGGSSRGIADTKRGLSDIGMSSRPLHPQEAEGITTHIVAMDGVTFVVHKDNPIASLSTQQAIAVYTGVISNWRELGGNDASITVIDRAKGRSETELLTEYLKLTSKDMKADVIAGENQQCVKLIIGNKNAIVYLSVGTAEYMVSQGSPLKLLALDGVAASTATVADRSFPIVRPLLFVTKSDADERVKSFLEFALSSQVNDLVRGQAFVPIR